MKELIKLLIIINIVSFVFLMFHGNLGDVKEVFVDFWGRFTIYSIWFVLYHLYMRLK